MTGTPWHVERIHRKEGDARRSKKRCQYYDNGDCVSYAQPCYGSAHCARYKEAEIKKTSNNNSKLHVAPVQTHKDRSQFTLVIVHTSNQMFDRIHDKVLKQGYYNFRGFVENAHWFAPYEGSQNIHVVFTYKHQLITTRLKPNKVLIVRSGDYITVAFPIVRFAEVMNFKQKHYRLIVQGVDCFYGKVQIIQKK